MKKQIFPVCIVMASLALAVAPAIAAEMVEKGPRGGQLVDVADRFHLELVVEGQELRLFVTDTKDRPIALAKATARAIVIAAGGKSQVTLAPVGVGEMRGIGPFARVPGMSVDIVLTLPGESQPLAAKFQPLAAKSTQKHDHKGHKH